jgi:hypothetical protein
MAAAPTSEVVEAEHKILEREKVWKLADAEQLSLDDFLKNNKPSTTTGAGPWIWVDAKPDGWFASKKGKEGDVESLMDIIEEWDEITEECQRIKVTARLHAHTCSMYADFFTLQDDPSIPVRASVAKGSSKAQRIAQIADDAKTKLRTFGVNRGFDVGKW